jgi:hypothetical protein
VASTTLFEQLSYRAEEGNELRLAVLKTLAAGPLLAQFPFVQYSGGAYPYVLQDEMPKVRARLINEANETRRGSVKQGAETFKNYGADVVTDKSLLATQGMDAHDQEIISTAESMRMLMETSIIRGDNAGTTGREFNGLREILKTNSSQRINNTTGSAAAMSFSALDELIAAVDGPDTDKRLIWPKKLFTKLGKAQRTPSVSGNIDFDINAVGIRAPYYGGVEIIPVDVDSDNVPIIDFDEPNDTCSVYCVNMGERKLFGIEGPSLNKQNELENGLVVYDVGESTSTPSLITRISYHVSIVLQNPKMAAALGKITNADIAP